MKGYAGQHFAGIDRHRRRTETPSSAIKCAPGWRSSDGSRPPVEAGLRDSANCERFDQTRRRVGACPGRIAGASSGNPVK